MQKGRAARVCTKNEAGMQQGGSSPMIHPVAAFTSARERRCYLTLVEHLLRYDLAANFTTRILRGVDVDVHAAIEQERLIRRADRHLS